MTIIKKTIGKSIYQYDVTWSKKKKKQVWKYIGKISTNKKTDIGKLFTNNEIKQIRTAYEMAQRNRYGKIRDTLEMICNKIKIKI